MDVDMTMNRRQMLTGSLIAGGAMILGASACSASVNRNAFPFRLTDAQWRRRLSPMQYYVLRQEGTERPGTSALLNEHRSGNFACAGCGQAAFASATKYDSGTGWPSFWRPLPRAIGTSNDNALGFARTEVHCSRCGGHLGHVFDDGPQPTGLRYCINGAALNFVPAR